MARRAKGSWPGTPEEVRDRDRVVKLVKRVGKNRLSFTVRELRREMVQDDCLQLEINSELWRHLAALDGDLIEEVGRRDFGNGGEKGGHRGKKKYALRSRLPDLVNEADRPARDLDDIERVHIAIWVATRALKLEEVPTIRITEVLKNIEPLALTKSYQTHTLLHPLAKRAVPLVEKVRVHGQQWVLWRPVGDPPSHSEFDGWVAEFRRIKAGDPDTDAPGRATLNEVGRDLLRLTLQASRSTTYPTGRSARLPDVRAFAGKDKKGKQLAASLRRRARSLGEVIVDASRERFSGRERVNVRIARLRGPLSREAYYDIPDEPGFDHRRRIVWLQDLRKALKQGILHEIEEDVRGAEHLRMSYPAAGKELEAVIAARGVLAQREFEQLEDILTEVTADRTAFSRAIQDEISEHRRDLNRFLSRRIWTGEEPQILYEAGQEFGFSPEEVLAAPRPLITPHEFVKWHPKMQSEGYTPAEFMALAVSLRRIVNPDYTHRRDPDRSKAFPLLADRVEALPYAADRLMAHSASSLGAGQRLLGRNLRSPELIRLLANSHDAGLRKDALAALVLLGDPASERIGSEMLQAPDTPADTIASTLRVLHLTERLKLQKLPGHVRAHQSWIVAAALREVILAQANGQVLV